MDQREYIETPSIDGSGLPFITLFFGYQARQEKWRVVSII
jgi:hypothetical protein